MGRSVEEFIKYLKIMSGTGNGVGASTVVKIERIAIKEGFIKPTNPPKSR